MDSNGRAVISAKWSELLHKGASIAREGIDYVNKQITEIRTTSKTSFSDEDSTSSASFMRPLHSRREELLVFYQIQGCHCNCEEAGATFARNTLSNEPTKKPNLAAHHLESKMMEPNLLSVPLPSSSSSLGHFVRVSDVRRHLPIPMWRYRSHLRFKALAVPDDVQAIGSSFVWLDLPESAKIPLINGVAYLKLLITPQNRITPIKTDEGRSPDRKPRKDDRRKHSPSDVSAGAVAFLMAPGRIVDDAEEVAESPRRTTTTTGARVQRAVDAHLERRARESAQAAAKYVAAESLAADLDRWALAADGSFKDLRALLSSLSGVLWEGCPWEPVALSDLLIMKPAEFKRLYRNALLLCHPDKHQNSSVEVQFRAQRIFTALNESFKAMKGKSA